MVSRTAHRVLCLSEAIANDLCGDSKRLRQLATVVHPGVDLTAFAVPPDPPAPTKAAVVGHISHVKRTDLAIDIAERVASEVPEFRLRVVGRAQFRDEDFALERELQERARSSPALAATVEFAGFATDIGEALRNCGLLLHCRPDEPFGIALIEAMAVGVPVVAPASAGPLEIVEDGETGILYEPGDVAAGAAAVLRLLDDPGVARQMGLAARARVEKHFALERQLAQTHALLSR
jgi:glycosyltransferase involved in cell wall biosynthesis